ncbi:MAG: response regulator [Oligoflexales bacterium]|nr:response regulator [Oligoflexales bacterium]
MGSLPTLLIVDDHEETVYLLAKSLEKVSAKAYKAFDGKAAWELFEAHKPDLVITDFGMPQMDGVELAKLIKNSSPNTPVFLVSGYSGEKRIDLALFDEVYSKPFKVKHLQASVVAYTEEKIAK